MSMESFAEQWERLRSQSLLPLALYLLVDPAQDDRLPHAIVRAAHGVPSRCLFGIKDGPDLEKAAPYLIAMPPFDARRDFWKAVFDNGAANPPCQTLIASSQTFDELYAHLRSYTEVVMPDGDEMVLAYWDPAILGTLVGQEDDATLHVPGPVLTPPQRAHFLSNSEGWWYWGRNGLLHRVTPSVHPSVHALPPLKLTQLQVDELVEASVPDHLLSYIRDNRPPLLAPYSPLEQYMQVKGHLQDARKLGLSGMRDMLNYICIAFIKGDRAASDPVVRAMVAGSK